VPKVETLRRLVNELAQTMEEELVAESKKKPGKPAKHRVENSLLLAHWEAQSYNGEQYVDLYDFCDCLQKRVPSPEIAKRCETLKKFIATEFVLKSCYCGAIYQYSYGVSIYFPWANIAPAYWNLDFVDEKAPGWGSFLKAYTRLTRRLPRNGTTDHRMKYSRENEENAASHRMVLDRMVLDRMYYDRMGSASNRVHSMRNPPATFNPEECVKDGADVVKCQKRFRMR